ncbi:hypothetical protein AYO40_05670 [Planctomycetaceae bacterium SCGC AG-212-D15]|nr:hypothetical protein AYO40_05670 [Planctomycetaceae bacterium SCGC AG-212-D15]
MVFLAANGHSKADDKLAYSFFLGVAPALAYLIFRSANRSNRLGGTAVGHGILFVQSLLLIVVLAVFSIQGEFSYPLALFFSSLHIASVAGLTLLNWACPRELGRADQGLFHPGNKLMAPFLPALLCCYVVAWDPGIRERVSSWWKTPSFGIATVLGALFVPGLLFMNARHRQVTSRQRLAFQLLELAAILVGPLLLIDVLLHFEWLHYSAYLGPANAVMCGRLPLVDVHCQYGLCYLVYVLALKCGLPHSYTSAALVTSVVNVVMYVVFLCILRKVVRQRFLAYAGGLLFLVFWHHWHVTINTTPSVAGMRYLPQLLMLLSILSIPRGQHLTIWTALTSVLCTFWSAECAIFGLGAYLTFLLVRARLKHERLAVLRSIGYLTAIVGASILGLALTLRLGSGDWPRFDLYLDFVAAFGNARGGYLSRLWTIIADLRFLEWLPIALAYFLCVCFAAKLFLENGARDDEQPVEYASAVLPIAFLGAIQLSLYAGRSNWPNLLSASFPFAILFFIHLDRALASSSEWPVRHRITTVALRLLAVPALGLLAGLAVSAICLSEYSLLSFSVVRAAKYAVATPWSCSDPDARIPIDCSAPHWYTSHDRFLEAKAMVSQWAQDDPALLLFLPESSQILFQLRKINKYPYSCAANEQGVVPLVEWIVRHPLPIRENDMLFVARQFEEMQPLEQRLLYEIDSKWDMTLVDESAHVLAYRLVTRCEGTSGTDLRLPLRPAEVTTSSDGDADPSQAADNNLATYWCSRPASTPEEEWVQIDLGSIREFDQVRILPFQGSESLFPADFVVEASTDMRSWKTLGRASDLKIPSLTSFESRKSAHGYDIRFPSLSARWVRLRGKACYSSLDSKYSLCIADIMVFALRTGF